MATQFISATGPPEILLHIFECCELFEDAWALALTCNYMYHVWKANDKGARLVWHFWQHEVPCVKEALIAVSTIIPDRRKR